VRRHDSGEFDETRDDGTGQRQGQNVLRFARSSSNRASGVTGQAEIEQRVQKTTDSNRGAHTPLLTLAYLPPADLDLMPGSAISRVRKHRLRRAILLGLPR
jgi:hypothetical protein